ncbi:MAG: methyltransferase domain-containing protein [Proteobacteria bacterium]|nr:methyltransferase domain-containing protein [Pseudomonadota bacterium]
MATGRRDATGAAEVASAFDRLAATWDESHGPGSPRAAEFSARLAFLRAVIGRFPRPRVLDVGCGTGLHLIRLADLLAEGVGIDLSAAMIARARESAARAGARHLRFAVGEAGALSADAIGRFEVVLMLGTLEHCPDQPAALAAARGVVAEGGTVVVVMPHPWNPLVALARALRAGGRPIPTRHLSPAALARLAGGCDLRLESVVALPFSPWRTGRGRGAGAIGARWREGRLRSLVRGAYGACLGVRPRAVADPGRNR